MMARFDKQTTDRWAGMARQWLGKYHPQHSPNSIVQGVDAWTVAHRCGITREAYKDRTVTDGHVQTALEAIFPNVVFKDKKVY